MGEIYTLVFIILSWFFALVVVIQVMVILDNDSSVKNFFTNYLKGLLTWSTIWLVIALCVNTLGAPEVPWALENEAAQLIRVALIKLIASLYAHLQNIDIEVLQNSWGHYADFSAINWPSWSGWLHHNAILFASAMWAASSEKPPAQTPKITSALNQPPANLAESFNSNEAIDYRSYVNPYDVRALSAKLVSKYPANAEGELWRTAAIFEYIKENVSYTPDPIFMKNGNKVQKDLITNPVETLELGTGDCDDQAVLMASMLSAVGIENRMLLMESQQGGWHLATEFAVDNSIEHQIDSELEKFYKKINRKIAKRSLMYFTEENKLWILADTTREFIGDYASLKSQGFMIEDSQGLTYWYRVEAYH